MKTATTVPAAIVLQRVGKVDGTTVLETSCPDYDHYRALPQVVEYEGVRCGKTGWNSDRGYACYQSNALMAQAVSRS
jgi:hypothetical protein